MKSGKIFALILFFCILIINCSWGAFAEKSVKKKEVFIQKYCRSNIEDAEIACFAYEKYLLKKNSKYDLSFLYAKMFYLYYVKNNKSNAMLYYGKSRKLYDEYHFERIGVKATNNYDSYVKFINIFQENLIKNYSIRWMTNINIDLITVSSNDQ